MVKQTMNAKSPSSSTHTSGTQRTQRVLRMPAGLVKTPGRSWENSSTRSTTVPLITRYYDLTIADFEEPIQEIMQEIASYLRDHALWILGEAGKGKTSLGMVVAMMFSRCHGGCGACRSTCVLNLLKGGGFSKQIPVIYDDGEIEIDSIKKKETYRT